MIFYDGEKMKKFILVLCILASNQAYALKIDSMLETGDEHGNGVFTLTNDKSSTSFISGQISQLEVENGELKKVPYTKENLSDWEVTLTSPKLILEAGRVKQVGVRSLCGSECDFATDRVYQITFSPVPYVQDPKKVTEPNLTINFGYAPLFIIPAKESHVEYQMTYKGNTVHVENTGNTYIRFMISKCTDDLKSKCQATYTSLSGRVKDFKVPSYLQDDKVEIMVVNHDESYKQKLVLDKNQTKNFGN